MFSLETTRKKETLGKENGGGWKKFPWAYRLHGSELVVPKCHREGQCMLCIAV